MIYNVFAPSAELTRRDAHKRRGRRKARFAGAGRRGVFSHQSAIGVFTHVIRMDSSYDEIIARTRAAGYAGPLAIGEDRMVIEVGDDVRVLPPRALELVGDVTSRGHG